MLYPDFNELVELKTKISSLKLLSNRLIKSLMTGNYFSPFRGHGLEFAEVRQYVAGDDVRKIDWRVTARTGTPHIKLFTEERERTALIVVDVNQSMCFGTRGTFKSIQAARCASLIAWCANKNSNKVGALLFGNVENGIEFLRPTRSRRSLWKMIKILSQKTEDKHQAITLDKALEFTNTVVSRSNIVFIISDFMNINDNLSKQLRYLSVHCQVVLLSVNDPADMNINSAGDILFSSDKLERLYVNTNSAAGQKAYEKQWLERCAKLNEISVNLGIHNISLSTNGDVYFDLFYGLKKTG